jgi:hypothetical protein
MQRTTRTIKIGQHNNVVMQWGGCGINPNMFDGRHPPQHLIQALEESERLIARFLMLFFVPEVPECHQGCLGSMYMY